MTWNRVAFLEKCVTSLLENIGDAAIMVMNKGSTGGMARFLDGLRGEKRLRKNYGLNAYKKLFGKTRSEYIVTVDAERVDQRRETARR